MYYHNFKFTLVIRLETNRTSINRTYLHTFIATLLFTAFFLPTPSLAEDEENKSRRITSTQFFLKYYILSALNWPLLLSTANDVLGKLMLVLSFKQTASFITFKINFNLEIIILFRQSAGFATQSLAFLTPSQDCFWGLDQKGFHTPVRSFGNFRSRRIEVAVLRTTVLILL
ncbi:hypothetical protein EAF00_008064 [Botryotinia globosa]|nr:hypothetical protein EAF00_008064 [Botryotinia globosa]